MVTYGPCLVYNVDFNGPLSKLYDYVVICGSGISGLVAAKRLSRLSDMNALYIEASEVYVFGLILNR